MEIIFLNKVYHPHDSSFFISVSTYLQDNSSVCTTLSPWGLRLIASHKLPKRLPHLTVWQCGHKAQCAWCHFCGNHFSWNFQRKGNTAHSGPTCSLYNCRCFPGHVCQCRVSSLFQKVQPRSTQYYSQFEKKICEWKRRTYQIAWLLRTRKEWGRTQYEKPFTWEGAFWLMENVYYPLSWLGHHTILEGMGAKQGI